MESLDEEVQVLENRERAIDEGEVGGGKPERGSISGSI